MASIQRFTSEDVLISGATAFCLMFSSTEASDLLRFVHNLLGNDADSLTVSNLGRLAQDSFIIVQLRELLGDLGLILGNALRLLIQLFLLAFQGSSRSCRGGSCHHT